MCVCMCVCVWPGSEISGGDGRFALTFLKIALKKNVRGRKYSDIVTKIARVRKQGKYFYGELEKHLHGGVCIPMHSDSQQCARTLGPITVYTNLSLTLVAQNYFTNFRHLHTIIQLGGALNYITTVFENIVCDIVSREFPELYHYRCT